MDEQETQDEQVDQQMRSRLEEIADLVGSTCLGGASGVDGRIFTTIFLYNPPFTVASVAWKDQRGHPRIALGVALCNPADHYDSWIGARLALRRAVGMTPALHLGARPLSKKQARGVYNHYRSAAYQAAQEQEQEANPLMLNDAMMEEMFKRLANLSPGPTTEAHTEDEDNVPF